MNKDKVIVLDFSIFQFRAVFSRLKMPVKMPLDYIILNMIISALKRIGVNPTSKVIVACDGRKNWRKDYSKEYKANRKEFRESFDIDWQEVWDTANNLLEVIDKGTDWFVVKEDRLEADDLMACASKFYKDNEVIIVSYDADLEQLWDRENVKIFSIMKKFRNGKGLYKVPKKNFNAYNLIAKKIQKEKSDNLISEVLTKEDYEKRRLVIDLLNLPKWIEDICFERFSNLKKEFEPDLSIVPYQKLREKIGGLYNNRDSIVTYEDSVKREERRKKKRSKK